MGEKRYIISDASRMLNVEAHVLRYWEEELAITIPRNEMGHRYYTENHINLLKNVRDLKKQGYGLRAIKMMITEPEDLKNKRNILEVREVTKTQPVAEGVPVGKMEQFQAIMDRIVSKALKESTSDLGKELSENVSENVLKGMDYLMRVQDEKEEERYKKLDAAMRSRQKISRKERKQKLKAEKMLTKKEKKKSLYFKKKPQTT